MKILFITGSMEPGRDGVGDYTRRLSAELIRLGHIITILALNDPHVTSELSAPQQIDGINIDIMVVRIPSVWHRKQRYERAIDFIKSFNPDWISVQFVPFAFQKKGLPFSLAKFLKKATANRKSHIMFHELWVGMSINSGNKLFWWGKLQQFLIRRMITAMKPVVMHTQTKLYQAQIAKMNFSINYLPLFSNIPVIKVTDTGNNAVELQPVKCIRFLLFGTLHPGVPAEHFISEVAKSAQQSGIAVLLIIIGKNGNEQERWSGLWKSFGNHAEILGMLPEKKVSEVLSSVTIGISTTPIALAEKSSIIAAMREHGLPVVCVSQPWQERQMLTFDPPEGISDYSKENMNDLLINLPKKKPGSMLEPVALQLLNSFAT